MHAVGKVPVWLSPVAASLWSSSLHLDASRTVCPSACASPCLFACHLMILPTLATSPSVLLPLWVVLCLELCSCRPRNSEASEPAQGSARHGTPSPAKGRTQ